jgi:hypothetical protein
MRNFILFVIAATLVMNAYADEHYKCYNLKNSHHNQEVSMKISTSLFSNKITSIDLISKVKATQIESVVNPFTTLGLSADELDTQAISEASRLDFKGITKKDSETEKSIIVSDSLLSFEEIGYAHYHSKACFWILDCEESYEYFKCEKI